MDKVEKQQKCCERCLVIPVAKDRTYCYWCEQIKEAENRVRCSCGKYNCTCPW